MISVIVGLVAAICVVLFRRTRYYKLATKLPHAQACPVLGHTLNIWVDKDEVLDKMLEIVNDKENKDILENKGVLAVWIGPMVVIVLDNLPDIEQVLVSRQLTRKAYQYKFFEPWLGKGLFTSSGAHWYKHRKLITPAFHFKILEKCIPVFNSKIEIFLKNIDTKVGTGSFNIEHTVANLSLDIIAETAMSAKIDAQTGQCEYAQKVRELTEIILTRSMRLLYYPEFIFNFSNIGRRHKENKEYIDQFVNKLVNQRKKERDKKESSVLNNYSDTAGKPRAALMDLLLETQNKTCLLNDKDILDEVNTFMFGGHDTITSGINFTLYLLSKHPTIQEDVHKEISMIVEDGHLTLKNLQELKYLERVIKESLRILPVAPLILRSVDQETKLRSGYTVPVGSTILIFIYKLHRNPDIFPNPEKFDPDRFLPDNCAKRHPYSYIPFSAGPRNCIGQKFAMLEMKAIIAAIIRRYRLLPTKEEVKPVVHTTLKSANGINLQVESRKDLRDL